MKINISHFLQTLIIVFIMIFILPISGCKDENHGEDNQKFLADVETIGSPIVGNSSATCYGLVASDNGFTVTERGFCYSTGITPTLSDSHITCGAGTGSFEGEISNLNATTRYYVKAYATNANGTSYGNTISFITDSIPPLPSDTIKANVYLTSGDQSKLFSKETDVLVQTTQATFPLITVDTSVTYQSIDGYGAALTGSSAYLLNRKMDSEARATLLRELFDPIMGIGISYLRLTMGASDFSLSNFSYDDVYSGQTDYQLEHFSLSQDTLDVVPIAKEILSINPEINFLGSPWSPPAWMKTSGNMIGGSLKTNCYDVYGDYFVKYIQSMGEKDIPIKAITPQNEPLYGGASYPCMDMSALEQLNFIKGYLGPKFNAAGVNTQIIIYDHNWDHPEYPISILNDQDTRQYITGSGFHAYGGNVSAMEQVHNAHPDKDLYFTEISGGEWSTDFSSNLLWNMRNIFIGTARNWSKNALLWNLALDENDGPHNNGCTDCRGVVTINSGSGEVTRNVEYYSLAHFTKFVRPGAIRTNVTWSSELLTIDAVSFMNTDKSKILVVANYGDNYVPFTIKQDKKYINLSIPEKSVVTIVWN